MQARTAARRGAADTNLSGNHVEDSTDLPFIQPSIKTGAKEVRSLPVCEQNVAARAVVGENFEARRMERDQPGLAELGVTDCENTFRPIDIRGSQVECLTDAQPGYSQKSEEAVVGPRLQAVRGWHVLGGFQQLVDLLIGIEVGFGTSVAIRQKALRRDGEGFWRKFIHPSALSILAPQSLPGPFIFYFFGCNYLGRSYNFLSQRIFSDLDVGTATGEDRSVGRAGAQDFIPSGILRPDPVTSTPRLPPR
jgi:hypothetical protein